MSLTAVSTDGSSAYAALMRPQVPRLWGERLLAGGRPPVTGGLAVSNERALPEPGEPSHAGVLPESSRWYRAVAPVHGTLSIDTLLTSFDTVLAVYMLTNGALVPLAASDDAQGTLQSAVSLPVVAGQTYELALGGKGAQSTLKARWTFTP